MALVCVVMCRRWHAVGTFCSASVQPCRADALCDPLGLFVADQRTTPECAVARRGWVEGVGEVHEPGAHCVEGVGELGSHRPKRPTICSRRLIEVTMSTMMSRVWSFIGHLRT